MSKSPEQQGQAVDIQAVLQTISIQRNQAMDQVASLSGRLEHVLKENEQMKKELATHDNAPAS